MKATVLAGVAVIVEALTDNKNRTAGDLRHYFDKCGGNLGQTGCVSFMFSEKGVIVIDNEDEKYTEDQVMEDCMEAGAEDFEFGDGVIEVSATNDPNEFRAVREALEAKGYTFVEADIQKVPSTYTKIDCTGAGRKDAEAARPAGGQRRRAGSLPQLGIRRRIMTNKNPPRLPSGNEVDFLFWQWDSTCLQVVEIILLRVGVGFLFLC